MFSNSFVFALNVAFIFLIAGSNLSSTAITQAIFKAVGKVSLEL